MSLRDLTNKRAFRRARKEAGQSGGRVCGTYKHDGRPIYFVMDAKATDDEIARMAFELREGRGLLDAEETLREMADRYRGRQ